MASYKDTLLEFPCDFPLKIMGKAEDELAQVCRQEQVSLIPYSPLAGGVLSGKYNDGALPADYAECSAYVEELKAAGQLTPQTMVNRTTNKIMIVSTMVVAVRGGNN